MNVERIISALPGMSHQEREGVRANAEKLAASGDSDKALAAARVIKALGELEASEHSELVNRLNGLEVSARVIEAFRVFPMTETEIKITQALLDNPNSTSAELSQALGWGAQSWHMHFGAMCAERAVYLWPAPKSEVRATDFYSCILANISADSRWTMKPEVAVALAEVGPRAQELPVGRLRSG
ncbi:MAG: hypothetical protein MEP57_03765 [Microvirga sp.]|nr:hypothetical protein [Microvirga sp.]